MYTPQRLHLCQVQGVAIPCKTLQLPAPGQMWSPGGKCDRPGVNVIALAFYRLDWITHPNTCTSRQFTSKIVSSPTTSYHSYHSSYPNHTLKSMILLELLRKVVILLGTLWYWMIHLNIVQYCPILSSLVRIPSNVHSSFFLSFDIVRNIEIIQRCLYYHLTQPPTHLGLFFYFNHLPLINSNM